MYMVTVTAFKWKEGFCCKSGFDINGSTLDSTDGCSLENMTKDSLHDRFTVEESVETEPEDNFIRNHQYCLKTIFSLNYYGTDNIVQ